MTAPAPLTAEINLDAIRHNLGLVRRAVAPNVRICPAVKADAYGHGIRVVLPALQAERLDRLAVATLPEAIELRELGWAGGVLLFGRAVLGATAAETRERADAIVAHGLVCTIAGRAEADALADAARRVGRAADVHVKLDTGMGRAGLPPGDAVALIRDLAAIRELRVEGVYTHFATADEADLSFARQQLAVLREATAALDVPIRHAANTAAVFRLPESHLDMVRPGIGMYGYWPDPNATPPVALRPSLRLVSPLVAVKRVPKGHAVGYGCTFVAPRDSVLGLAPIGYADGYRRSLSNGAVMTLRADSPARITVPVVGRISMDQTVIDLTDVPDPREGEPVVIIDDDPAAPNSVQTLARRMDTIPYEVTCGLGRRVHRVATKG